MTDSTPKSFRFGRYLLWVCALGCLLYPLPYFLIRAPHFDRWSTSPYGRDLESGFTATRIDADVLIYGDSTALYGLDPRRMSAELGLKVFNLPNLLPSLRVTDDLGLKRYLATNKPPRLIVFYLSPWDLDYTSYRATDAIYDGEEMLLRHGTATEIVAFARKHPTDYLQFPFIFYRVNTFAGLLHPSGPSALLAKGGHAEVPPHPPLSAGCALPAARTPGQVPFEAVRRLLNTYNTAETPAIVYLSPLPECRGIGIVTAYDLKPLHAAAPRVLPPGAITNDGYYSHPEPANIPEVTDQLVEAIRPLLEKR